MIRTKKHIVRKMRSRGKSIKSIAKELKVPQSSVSNWTRDIKLTESQLQILRNNMHSPSAIEKRRQSRLASERAKRNVIFDGAYRDLKKISQRELWLIGVSLYWAEGGKTQRTVRFSNGDPRMIELMMKFFIDVCNVDKKKIKGHIHIHESLDTKRAEAYWQKVTGIKPEKFYKTYSKPNKSSKGTRNSLPYGVCDIYCPDYRLFLKIEGWTKAIYDSSFA